MDWTSQVRYGSFLPQSLSNTFLDKDQRFAMDAGRAVLHWYLQGYGFDVEASDVRTALDATLKAATLLGEDGRIRAELSFQS